MNIRCSRTTASNRGFVGACFLWACAMPFTNLAVAQTPVAVDEVRGTIAVHGYELPPNAFQVRARPIHVHPGGDDRRSADCTDRAVVVTATEAGAAEPGRFEFSIRGLVPGIPYRIGVKLVRWGKGHSPRLVWSADRDPFVMPGEAAVQFDAYAVRSQFEVQGPAGDRKRARWVGADAVDFHDPLKATRTFRWRTTLPDVTGGRLQVSVKRFPRVAQRDYSPCDGDESGLLYTVDFPVDTRGGRWVTIPAVDFNALLDRSRRADEEVTATLPGTLGPAALDPHWETVILPKIEAGMPLYVRVLPMIGEEVLCDPEAGGVPPEVLIGLVKKVAEIISDPKISVENIIYNPPVWGYPPKPGEICYRVLKDHTLPELPWPFGWSSWELNASINLGLGPNQTIPAGATFCIGPGGGGGGGWLEDFAEGLGAVVTGLVDAVGSVVDYASKMWEDIQDGVVNAVADTLVNLGLPCDDECRALLETGLEIGLASMGVPPSLPNFEELTDQGLEYLASQAAAQFSPVTVPSFVTDYASAQAKQFVKEVAKDMKADYGVEGLPGWLAPDIRFQPASLQMDLYGRGKTQPFDSRPSILRLNTPIYTGASVQLPRHLPEKGVEPPLVFPMVLPANTANLSAPPGKTYKSLSGQPVTVFPNDYETAVWYWSHWLQVRYLPSSACYHLHLTAVSDPGGVYNILDIAFRPTDAKPCKP